MRFSILVVCIVLAAPSFGQSGNHSAADSVDVIIGSSRSTSDKIALLLTHAKNYGPERSGEAESVMLKALSLSLNAGVNSSIARCYQTLGEFYRGRSDYFKAIAAYKNALKYETANLAQIHLQLGISYLRITQLDSAKEVLLKGLELNQGADKHTEAALNNALGNVVKDQDDYKQALEYYLRATSIFEKLNDTGGLTQTISNVGNVEYLLKNYDLAMDYAKQSLRYAEESGVQSSVAYSNRLMGRIYRKQGKFDEALTSYREAIAIYQMLGARRDVSETHYNIGNIYYEKNDLTSAIGQYQAALAIQRTIPDYYNMAYSYSAIGQACFDLNLLDKSTLYLDSAQQLADAHKYPYIKLDVLDFKGMILSNKNRYREAYEMHVAYSLLKDSLTQQENRQAARELEAKYASQKKAEEIRTLKAESELAALRLQKQVATRNYLAGFAVLSIALIVVLYNRYKLKANTAKKLEDLDRVKSRFFTYVSHEFRTPLTLISGPLEQRMERTDDPEQKAELALMLKNSRRLTELINQLLDLAKLESGHMQLRLSSGDLHQVLKLLAASFLSLAEHKGVTFHVAINVDRNDAVLDRDKLEKIVSNLLSNAFKFTPSGGSVWFDAALSGDRLNVSVKDTGPGVPDDKLPYIFDRFYQLEDPSNRSHEGSGIGLALSKELAHLHNGTLTVNSIPGGGCEFLLNLPVNRDAYPSQVVSDSPAEEERVVPVIYKGGISPTAALDGDTEGKPVILVAEDNDDMRIFLTNILVSRYNVISAATGTEALEKAMAVVPDLIVTDVMMPGLDGMSLCGKIKTTPATNHIPVVILTARADSDSKLEGLQTGADDYLAKPFDGRELMARIHNLIEQRKLLQDVFREKVIWQPSQLNLREPDEAFMEEFISTLEGNYANAQFGVDQLCLEVGLSRMQLHRKLKAITGKSPGDFLRSFRVERAKQMLVSGVSVSDAAFQAGFNNLSNFSKLFREHTGSLPSEFAAKGKKKPM